MFFLINVRVHKSYLRCNKARQTYNSKIFIRSLKGKQFRFLFSVHFFLAHELYTFIVSSINLSCVFFFFFYTNVTEDFVRLYMNLKRIN